MELATYKLLEELKSYPIFSVNDLSLLTGQDADYSKMVLHRLSKKGLVYRVKRDSYTVHSDPLLFASSLIWPSYISLWYALRFHDLTEQVPYRLDVLTPATHRLEAMNFKGYLISFLTISDKILFGYEKNRISDLDVFMAEPEKAIVDAIVLKKISIPEIVVVIDQNHERISIDGLIEMMIRTGSKAGAKRLGWILDHLEIIRSEKLHDMIYQTITSLESTFPLVGKKDPYWRIIVNIKEE